MSRQRRIPEDLTNRKQVGLYKSKTSSARKVCSHSMSCMYVYGSNMDVKAK